jgi:membrane protease YdiL (CAAX protease family)
VEIRFVTFASKPLGVFLLLVGVCFLAWTALLLAWPTAEFVRSVLKICVWLVPLWLFVRGPEAQFVWRVDVVRHGGPVLAATVAFALYFLMTRMLSGGGGAPDLSASFLLNAVVVAPPVEEAVFRGIVFRQLEDRLPWWAADVASALIFAAYHIPLWGARGRGLTLDGVAWVFAAGLVFGWVFWKTHSLGAATLVHASHNVLLQLLV